MSTEYEKTKTNKNVHNVNSSRNKTNKNSNKISKLKVIHWNSNSIKDKIELLSDFLKVEKPDIMSINEIKCTESLANSLLYLENYYPVFKCRNNESGGVLLLIKAGIEFSEIKIPIKINREIVGANIKPQKITISIFSYYNAPQESISSDLFNYIRDSQQIISSWAI